MAVLLFYTIGNCIKMELFNNKKTILYIPS